MHPSLAVVLVGGKFEHINSDFLETAARLGDSMVVVVTESASPTQEKVRRLRELGYTAVPAKNNCLGASVLACRPSIFASIDGPAPLAEAAVRSYGGLAVRLRAKTKLAA